MIDKTDFLLYGGAVLALVLVVVFLGYRLFYKKREGMIKNQVANKINDFYLTQDNKHTN